MIHYAPLLVFFAVTFCAAMTGSKFMPGVWYDELRKPSWTPPGWAFPVVWLVLYIMIAIAGWRVWSAAGWSWALLAWGVQLLLNAAWSWIMFGRRNIGLALVDALGMWVFIAAFMLLAWPIDQTATWLFLPYLVWVTIAAALNATILRMNAPQLALLR
jgi:translocator protein